MTNEPIKVWVATETYEGSAAVWVARTEQGVLKMLAEDITRSEFEEFVASLHGDQATDITYDDDPVLVLEVWGGESDHDVYEDGYVIGDTYWVREQVLGP